MAVLIENNVTLPNPAHARIGYRNATESISATSAADDAPATSARWGTGTRRPHELD